MNRRQFFSGLLGAAVAQIALAAMPARRNSYTSAWWRRLRRQVLGHQSAVSWRLSPQEIEAVLAAMATQAGMQYLSVPATGGIAPALPAPRSTAAEGAR